MLPVGIITLMDGKRLHLNVTLIRWTKGESWEHYEEQFIMENGYKIYFHSDFKRYEYFTFVYVKYTYKQINIIV